MLPATFPLLGVSNSEASKFTDAGGHVSWSILNAGRQLQTGRFTLRILRSLALLMVLTIPAAFAHSQVAVGIGIGPVVGFPAPVVVAGPPVCAWGYFPFFPYS